MFLPEEINAGKEHCLDRAVSVDFNLRETFLTDNLTTASLCLPIGFVMMRLYKRKERCGMKINQLIREKRKELSMTQEQMAAYLGVSAPAVHKWEKGATYPDITLLPALARLLKTDVNTLLSFQEDLTDIEIESFVNGLDKTAQEQGYEVAFQMALDKIQEYPTCEKLLYSVSFYLEGALFLYNVPQQERYKDVLEGFYLRLSKSETDEIRETAIGMLIPYNRNRGDYAKAEELIKSLPFSRIDREEQLAALYTQQGKYEEAKKKWEHRVLGGVSQIQTALMNMMEIALREEREEDAVFYADLYETVSGQFHLVKWSAYTAQMQLAVAQKDSDRCIAILAKMLPAMKESWNPKDSPLYRNLNGKENTTFSKRVLDTVCNDLVNGEEFAFVRGNAEFERLMAGL